MTGFAGLATCVRNHVANIVATQDATALSQLLATPGDAVAVLAPAFRSALESAAIDVGSLCHWIRSEPCLHLESVFDPTDLPATPQAWVPVPTTRCTLAAKVAVVLLNNVCGMETVSYGSENEGELYVNLVTLPGQGAIAEKSKGPMRGHTDAASFPFRGTKNSEFPRLSPSPDVVFLAAFRNPEKVPTILMPLIDALSDLSEAHVRLLKGPAMTIQTQRTFRRGAASALGKELILDGVNVLFDSPEGTWVRYSHSQTTIYDESDPAAVEAKAGFEAACAACARGFVLQPGDLLVVNNRKALHGRSPVGDAIGGNSRWLMRSYGLDTTELLDNQRHESTRHKLYP